MLVWGGVVSRDDLRAWVFAWVVWFMCVFVVWVGML